MEHDAEIEFAKKAKQTGDRVGFVGAMATALSDVFLQYGDFVVRGEPEAMMLRYRPENMKGVVNSGIVDDLDGLPFPDWSIFDCHSFSYSIYVKAKPLFPILSSRGCPHPCGYYCPYPVTQGRHFRARTPENVIEEIRYLIKNFGARSLLFRDPIFSYDMERVVLIAEGMIRNRFNLKWACETRPADLSDGRLLELMYRAGLRGLNIGIESSEASVLKASRRKDFSREDIFKLVDLCRGLGIRIGAFYTLGQMAGSRETIENTIRFAKALNTEYAQFTIATPYPGTMFFDEVKDLIASGNWQEFNGYTPVFKHPSLSFSELLDFKKKAMQSYYLRPGWLLRYPGLM